MPESTLADQIVKLRRRWTAPLILELDLTEGIAEEPPADPVSALLTMRRPRLNDVFDGLRRARIEQDPSLAMRFSCLNANACKECMMLLDGKVIYACTARLEAREMRVEPLPNKTLVRDLVTEIAPPDERIANRRG